MKVTLCSQRLGDAMIIAVSMYNAHYHKTYGLHNDNLWLTLLLITFRQLPDDNRNIEVCLHFGVIYM